MKVERYKTFHVGFDNFQTRLVLMGLSDGRDK